MIIYKPCSVVVVPFPFTDSGKSKRRPALVVSSSDHQMQTSHITLMMITSAKNSAWLGDHEIRDLDKVGLNVSSIVRQKLFTIDSRLILRKLGELSPRDRKEVVTGLKKHLGM